MVLSRTIERCLDGMSYEAEPARVIAERLGMGKSNLLRVLKEMAALGLVEKTELNIPTATAIIRVGWRKCQH